jgi:putative ABC transport system substrate-binding protein
MRRRGFIVLLGGAAAWPFAASAQQSVPVIGVLHSASAGAFAPLLVTLREGLSEAGYIDGQNVRIEYRFAEGQYDRLPTMAAELVSQQVVLIVAGGGDRPALAAKAATTTIPIVFTGSDDPVKFGLVESLNHPGANVTGVSFFGSKLEVKKFALLRDLAPTIPRMAMLVTPSRPESGLLRCDACCSTGSRGASSRPRNFGLASSFFAQSRFDGVALGSRATCGQAPSISS